jgi:hypothetical protein
MTAAIKNYSGKTWKFIQDYYSKNPEGHYFDHDTLKFFGERTSEMRVLKNTTVIKNYKGEKQECYILSSLQRNHPSGPTRKYTYFDIETLDHVIYVAEFNK